MSFSTPTPVFASVEVRSLEDDARVVPDVSFRQAGSFLYICVYDAFHRTALRPCCRHVDLSQL